jgi:hypothetical protein
MLDAEGVAVDAGLSPETKKFLQTLAQNQHQDEFDEIIYEERRGSTASAEQ